MANLKEIRLRIKSVKSTQQITKAMKMVSAAKLRRAQDNIIQLRPYSRKLQEILGNLTASLEGSNSSPFSTIRDVEKVLIVVVTSNRGLCGAFNSNVCKLALQIAEEQYSSQLSSGNVTFLCIGKKGFDFFSKRKFKVFENVCFDPFANISFSNVNEIAEKVMNGFLNEDWDKVELVYNEFKNVATQNRIAESFLPLVPTEKKVSESSKSDDYIFEPDQESILNEIIPKSLKIQFYRSVLESNASEHGARMTAMDKATENANDLLFKLKLFYNRARQASITNEILEIVSGANALASK